MRGLVCKLFLRAVLIAGIVLLFGAKNQDQLTYKYPRTSTAGFRYPDASFAVISDTHIADPSLGVPGFDFEDSSGRKLTLDSITILDHAIKTIISSGVRFVLISGDLTKDGELASHRLMEKKLKAFTDAGIAVYVIPGNHDINNPNAVNMTGEKTEKVPSVSAEEFSQIYGNYGFNSALMRDDDSLSYVAEPAEGLWLLALDSCRYREYTAENGGLSSGKVSQKTADWIAAVLQAAQNNNKAVMVMIHHGVIEHWKGQAKFHASYLIKDYKNFGKFLASWNVKLVFSGHYHSQDITSSKFGKKVLYDIETGALLIPSCPVRFVEIKNNALQIRSEAIADKIYPNTDFAQNVQAFIKKTITAEAVRILKRYKVTGKDAEYIADIIADAFYAHFEGDENPARRLPYDKRKISLWSRFLYNRQKHLIDNLWKDFPPADNNLQFNL